MKKRYLALCSIVISISTSCMERERKRDCYEEEEEIALTTFNNNFHQHQYSIMPPLYNTAIYSTPGCCEADAPGWEKLHDIAYMSYNSNQRPIINTTVAPVHQTNNYAYTTTHTSAHPIAVIQPDQKIIQKLYDDAYQFFNNANKKSLQLSYDSFCNIPCKRKLHNFGSKKVARLAYTMNESKKDNIDENIMEHFAYKQQKITNASSIYTTLFFNFLKKYNIAAHETNEALPFDPDATESSLIQTFCVSIDNNKKDSSLNNKTYEQQYPAFSRLLRILSVLHYFFPDECHGLISWMHSKQTITLDDYSAGLYTNLITEFYDKACQLSEKNKTHHERYQALYELIQIIARAKNNNDINDKHNFGKKILNIKPTIAETLFSAQNDLCIINKQKAALLYAHIEKYNTARGNKITPTPQQACKYDIVKELQLILPYSLTNSLFNHHIYAFDEFEELIYDSATLYRDTKKETIQECIEQIYY